VITANGEGVNGDPMQPSEIVEFTKNGEFVGQFNLLGYGKSVIDFNAKIPHRAFDFYARYCSQIASG
jgi:hypothetical protein